jgi:hypothetical protein
LPPSDACRAWLQGAQAGYQADAPDGLRRLPLAATLGLLTRRWPILLP